MSEPKHTPGPWKINKRSWPMTITGNIHLITNNDRLPAAFVPAWDDPQAGEEDGSEEALANAHLIASATELLDALRELVGLYDGGKSWSPHDHPVVVARAAIAKAEGRTA